MTRARKSSNMNTKRRWLMTSRGLRRLIEPTYAGQSVGLVAAREGDYGSRPAQEWSLRRHSSGQEPWVLGLEELLRLQREAGNADGLAGEAA